MLKTWFSRQHDSPASKAMTLYCRRMRFICGATRRQRLELVVHEDDRRAREPEKSPIPIPDQRPCFSSEADVTAMATVSALKDPSVVPALLI